MTPRRPPKQVDDELSLEQVENDRWGPAPKDATRLIATVHALRRKPLRALTPEDLRLLVGQQVGLPVLIPRTLALLEREPMLEGDFYAGDVLVSVLRVPASYWRAHPTELALVERILAAGPDVKSDIDAFRDRLRDS
ncbi:contact-dependent growth inhibition system immunity protein [Saccharothrix deserti]|uniref:contact-dependent growth inhibition system immunity protein n=1 Tax=Saccharothrix deserti TaxID=2593674 RepID=UPI00131A78DF|nr:contact-dependent growth inhibition system immunity protein [Saccharothrix deserti]